MHLLSLFARRRRRWRSTASSTPGMISENHATIPCSPLRAKSITIHDLRLLRQLPKLARWRWQLLTRQFRLDLHTATGRPWCSWQMLHYGETVHPDARGTINLRGVVSLEQDRRHASGGQGGCGTEDRGRVCAFSLSKWQTLWTGLVEQPR